MNHAFPAIEFASPSLAAFAVVEAKDAFRRQFQCALSQCIRRGFCVEEAFGIIWEETIEEIELSYSEQNELYPELIAWAKRWMR